MEILLNVKPAQLVPSKPYPDRPDVVLALLLLVPHQPDEHLVQQGSSQRSAGAVPYLDDQAGVVPYLDDQTLNALNALDLELCLLGYRESGMA